MGWLITFGVLAALAMIPLGAEVQFDSDGLLVRVIAGFVRLQIVPKKPGKSKNSPQKKDKKQKKKEPTPAAKRQKKETAEEAPKAKKSKTGGSLTDFLPLVKTGLELLGAFRRKLRLNHLQLKVIMAGGDPCDLAVNYGRAWAALAALLPKLEQCFVIRKRDLEVECDFTSEETRIIAHLDITITFGRLLAILVVYGAKAVFQFLKIMKKRKGGALNESKAS